MPSLYLVRAVQTPTDISNIRPCTGVRGIWPVITYNGNAVITEEGVCYFVVEPIMNVINSYGFIHDGIEYVFNIRDSTIMLCRVESYVETVVGKCQSPWPAETKASFYVNVVRSDHTSVTVDMINYALIATITVAFFGTQNQHLN